MKVLSIASKFTVGAVFVLGTLSATAGPSEQFRVTANSLPDSSPSPLSTQVDAVKTPGFQKYVTHRSHRSMPKETAEFAAFEKAPKKRDRIYYRRDRNL